MSLTRTGLALVCSWLLPHAFAQAAAVEFNQFPSGHAISQSQLPEAICRGWVEVRTTSSAQVIFWDILLDVERNSRLLLGCNKDYIYALTLTGRFDNGHQVITPGMVSLWTHFGGKGEGAAIYDFSAGALMKMIAVSGQEADPGLDALARLQKTAPVSLELGGGEALLAAPAGQSFRTFPEILAIKRASRHLADYGLRTATQFANALSQRDTTLLAALLAPTLFEEGSTAVSSSVKPSPARVAFAERLLALNDYQLLPSAPGLRELGNLQYEMRTAKQSFRITLQLTEGCLYVKRLDPTP